MYLFADPRDVIKTDRDTRIVQMKRRKQKKKLSAKNCIFVYRSVYSRINVCPRRNIIIRIYQIKTRETTTCQTRIQRRTNTIFYNVEIIRALLLYRVSCGSGYADRK